MDRVSLGSSAEQDALSGLRETCVPALQFSEGETIYDYTWFPAMHSGDPVSCVFATTSRVCPLLLGRAFVGHGVPRKREGPSPDSVSRPYEHPTVCQEAALKGS